MATIPSPTEATPTTEAFIDALAAALVTKFKQHLIRKYPELAAVFHEPPTPKPGCVLLRVPKLTPDPIYNGSFLGRQFPVEH